MISSPLTPVNLNAHPCILVIKKLCLLKKSCTNLNFQYAQPVGHSMQVSPPEARHASQTMTNLAQSFLNNARWSFSRFQPPGFLTLILNQGDPPVQGREAHKRTGGEDGDFLVASRSANACPSLLRAFIFSVIRTILQPLLELVVCPSRLCSPVQYSTMIRSCSGVSFGRFRPWGLPEFSF